MTASSQSEKSWFVGQAFSLGNRRTFYWSGLWRSHCSTQSMFGSNWGNWFAEWTFCPEKSSALTCPV